MGSELMTNSHQCDASAWCLLPGRAITLRIGASAREICVREGRVWLTLTEPAGHLPMDWWLSQGERMVLPAHARVVMEAWPEARFELLVPPALAPRRWMRRALRWVFRRLRGQGPVGLELQV